VQLAKQTKATSNDPWLKRKSVYGIKIGALSMQHCEHGTRRPLRWVATTAPIAISANNAAYNVSFDSSNCSSFSEESFLTP
jgi:hypothetical protein